MNKFEILKPLAKPKNLIIIFCLIAIPFLCSRPKKDTSEMDREDMLRMKLDGYWTKKFEVYEYRHGQKDTIYTDVPDNNGVYKIHVWKLIYRGLLSSTPEECIASYDKINNEVTAYFSKTKRYRTRFKFRHIEDFFDNYKNDTLFFPYRSFSELTEREKFKTDSVLVLEVYTRDKPFFLRNAFIANNKGKIKFNIDEELLVK